MNMNINIYILLFSFDLIEQQGILTGVTAPVLDCHLSVANEEWKNRLELNIFLEKR